MYKRKNKELETCYICSNSTNIKSLFTYLADEAEILLFCQACNMDIELMIKNLKALVKNQTQESKNN